MLEIYDHEYDPIEQLYKMQGRTGLLKAYNLLITKINEEITLHNELKVSSRVKSQGVANHSHRPCRTICDHLESRYLIDENLP